MTVYEWITTLAVPVTGIASWRAATRLRQNKTICEIQETVFKLVEENKRVYAELTEARKEIVNLSTQVARLTLENAELKQLIENITS